MKVYYDLHIHTVASHCADDTMLPHDIAGMAYIKGLDIITALDHVCGVNMRVCAKAANEHGLLFLPGIEVTTTNGIHLLCYFSNLDDAQKFSDMIYDSLPNKKNNSYYFGPQYIVDDTDKIISEVKKGLFQKTPFDVWQVIGLCEEYRGVCVPAHINRDIHGILAVHDDISEYNFNCVEVQKSLDIDKRHLKNKKIIHNSDAHSITSINERENFIDIDEKSVEAVFEYLKY